jgi:hypothetical protein
MQPGVGDDMHVDQQLGQWKGVSGVGVGLRIEGGDHDGTW